MNKIKELYDFVRETSQQPGCREFILAGCELLGIPIEDLEKIDDLWSQIWFIAAATVGYKLAERHRADEDRGLQLESQPIGQVQVTCECGQTWLATVFRRDLYIGVIPAITLGIVKDDATIGFLVTRCRCGRRVEKEIKQAHIDAWKLAQEE